MTASGSEPAPHEQPPGLPARVAACPIGIAAKASAAAVVANVARRTNGREIRKE